jgi:cell wall-associated NlpC family hydrolase
MYRRRRTRRFSKLNGTFCRIYDAFIHLSKRTRIIILGGAAVLLAAIVIVLAIPHDTSTLAQQDDSYALAAADAIPVVPTESPTPTPSPAPTPTPDPTLQRGDESEKVQELQQRLMELGYLDIDETTLLYGPATEYAVFLFQRQHELQQDGIAGPQTLELIFSEQAQKYMLLEGTKGEDVDSLQRQLVDLGYLSKATGYYGTETVAAIEEFQSRNSLDVDGMTGHYTLDMIYSPDAKPSANKVNAEKRRANVLEMLEVAADQIGDPYRLGREGPDSFDCSGLVYYCLKQAGSSRGRYNAAGYSKVSDWEKISSMGDLEKGDLIFFWNSGKSKVGHVGIYIGGGKMIDASSGNGKVVKRSCTTSYWKKMFVCGRRPW